MVRWNDLTKLYQWRVANGLNNVAGNVHGIFPGISVKAKYESKFPESLSKNQQEIQK
jgi:hypothetical protein